MSAGRRSGVSAARGLARRCVRLSESAARALGRVADRASWLRRPVGAVPRLDGSTIARERDRYRRPGPRTTSGSTRGDPGAPGRVRAPARPRARRRRGRRSGGRRASSGCPRSSRPRRRERTRPRPEASRSGWPTSRPWRRQQRGSVPPVIVQPMVAGGAELLAGVVQDPVFGPLVAFGPGGVLAELVGDALFRIAPLTDVDAHELVTSGRAGRLVAGFRGAPAADAPRSSTSFTGWAGSVRSSRRSPARPQPGSRPSPTAVSRSMPASACVGPTRSRAPSPGSGALRPLGDHVVSAPRCRVARGRLRSR